MSPLACTLDETPFHSHIQTQYIQMRKTNPPDRKFKVKHLSQLCTLSFSLSFLPSLSLSSLLSTTSLTICLVPSQGSVFVEFCEKEDFEKFLRLDVVMFRDKELLRESK